MDITGLVKTLEIAILRSHLNNNTTFENHEEEAVSCVTCVNLLITGKFQEVLAIGKSLGVLQSFEGTVTSYDPEKWRLCVEKYLNDKEEIKEYRKLIVLCVGIASLQLFVQNNWVGPLTEEARFLAGDVDAVLSQLSVDGEDLQICVRHPIYLWMAEGILLHCRKAIQSLTSEWWLMRCLQSHQALIDERSPTLKSAVVEIIDNFTRNEEIAANDTYIDLTIQFHLEAGHLCYFYYEPRQAKDYFDQAEKLCGLNITLTGQMGKRTRYQQKEISQLVLQVSQRDGSQPWSPPEGDTGPIVPTNVALEDDTVLERIKLTDGDKEIVCDVSGVQQAVILGLCHRHRKTREGHGKIIQEESLAYINGAVVCPRSWSVQTSTLVMRSDWECDSSRLVQRSMSQLEELVNQVRRPEPDASVRLPLVYCCKLPSVWDVQRHLAALFERMGAIKAAMEVYERIQAWEDVIKCYAHIGLKEKADRLIQEQLAVKETPLLWCFLGDIHNEAKHYETAWKLSKGRFGRAQRSLGFLHLHKKEFEESLPCFEKSLKVNSLQNGVWFSYGCAALACQNYETAAKAYRRCVNLDGDNFQAWCNLATAYIRSNQKARAFPVLQEALKCEYESWQIWENYLLVSVDIGQFEETVRAYHRLLDIKDKYADVEVLEVLVRAVRENLKDALDHPAARLKPKIQELFGRITSKITSNADMWRLYGEVVMCGQESEQTDTDRQKALQYLQKAHRCTTQAPSWERDVNKSTDVIRQSTDLAKVYLDFSSKTTDKEQARQMLGAARLMIKGTLAKVKQHHIDAITGDLISELQEPYRTLEELLSVITETQQLT